MKKINFKLIFCVLIVLLIGISFVNRTLQNDLFFTIPLGNNILNNGYSVNEVLTYHNDYSFYNVRWLFDIIIAIIYNNCGFDGIYIFTVVLSCVISVLVFSIIYKRSKKPIFSLVYTAFGMLVINEMITARAQLISTIIFIIQYYCLEELLKSNKLRYKIILLVLPVLLVNIHGSVFPMYFIFYLPFIAEYLLTKSPKLENYFKKLDVDKSINYKPLFIIILVNLFEGLINPNGLYPYYMMFATFVGISSRIISEMQPITAEFLIAAIVMLTQFFAHNYKQKTHQFCMFIGLTMMAFMTIRSSIYYYTIGLIIASQYTNTVIDKSFEIKKELFKNSFLRILKIIIVICIVVLCFFTFISNYNNLYLPKSFYPIEATAFLKDNIDLDKEVLYNDFNFGSFLEFNGIKTFIDSRAEVFEKPFNDTTILHDLVYACYTDKVDYNEFFEKYGFTIIMTSKKNDLYKKANGDNSLVCLYEDDYFVIWRIK